jgi:polyketide synthase PksN
MNEITDQKRLELAYKKILSLQEKLKESNSANNTLLNSEHVPVAVIGAGCRYPGGVQNVQDLWNCFEKNINLITEIPQTRWNLSEIVSANRSAPNKTYCRYGSFFPEIDQFDPLFFNISHKEAERMDPQQRLFLQGCWEAFEDAGYNDSRLSGVKCGVYAGSLNCDYTNVLNDTPHDMDLFELMGTQSSILSARISYLMNLKGPSITIDTACSSSLVAIDLAVKAIQRGEIELAIAGGVHLYITPNLYIMMSKAQMLSENGQSKAFDNDANGFVPGEGMAVVVLKRLDQAISDGDQIYGVILGGTSNQDGKTNGITAPSSIAQTELQIEAFNRLGVCPSTIGYVEAHGTGTKLGDPIEFEALTESFRKHTQQAHYCAIGSSKTNFGHTLSAAGVTGVLKALLSLKNKKIPANLNFNSVNEHLEYAESPFYINNTLIDWPQPANSPRRSAVNSFGFSGTNVHLVLEEAPNLIRNESDVLPPAYLMLLSAKTKTALTRKINDMHRWLEQSDSAILLKDIALTLMRGRCHFKFRTGFIVTSKGELLKKLNDWSVVGSHPQVTSTDEDVNFLLGKLTSFNEISSEDYTEGLESLLRRYVEGVNCNWHDLLTRADARTVSLPNYPFENERHWISPQGSEPQKSAEAVLDKSFSFVDANVSTLESQCYQKTFTGNEFYLKDHVVNLRKMLPGVAYLEMARSSGNHCNKPQKVTRIENVIWKNPIVVDGGPQTVKISLHPQNGKVNFQIFSTTSDDAKGIIHSTGTLSYAQLGSNQDEYLNIEELRSELTEFMSQKQCYDSFKERGLIYGSTFKRILNLSYKNDRALATIEGSDDDDSSDALHPGIVDAALQALLVLVNQLVKTANQHYLPYSIESLEIRNPLTTRCYSYVSRRANVNLDGAAEFFDVTLTDEKGRILLVVSGLKLVPVKQNIDSMTNLAESLYYTNSVTTASIQEIASEKFHNNSLINNIDHNTASIIVIGNSQEIDGLVDDGLLKQYLSPTYVKNAREFIPLEHDTIHLSLNDPDHATLLHQELAKNNLLPRYVIWLPDSKINNLEDFVIKQLQFKCSLIRLMIKSKLSNPVRFLSTEIAESDALQSGTANSAFFKTLALENPHYVGKHITYSAITDKRSYTQSIINELFNPHFTPHQVFYKNGQRYKKHLTKLNVADESFDTSKKGSGSIFKPGHVYLITGGLKGVGFELTQYIARVADVHLILIGRSAPDKQQLDRLDNLKALFKTGSISYYKVDVTNQAELERFHSQILEKHTSLNGVLHSAGVKNDSFILKKQNTEIEAVLAPKVSGTINLDDVTKNDNLDFFVLFSSIASVFGNPGQSDYAFANGFMDDFAAYRWELVKAGSRKGKSVSINWPLWQNGGMQLDDGTMASMRELFGMRPIDSRLGYRALENSIELAHPTIMYMYGDQVKTDKTLKSGIASEHKQVPTDIAQFDNEQRVSIQVESEHFLKLLISDEMKIPYEKLDSDAAFENFGMDSVVYMSLNRKLEEKFGKISKTLFYEHQNVAALASYFIANHLGRILDIADVKIEDSRVADNETAALDHAIELPTINHYERFKQVSEPTKEKVVDIAIIGLSGKYPQANSLDEYWENLVSGKDCIQEIPSDRWDHSQYFSAERGTPGKTYTKWGGFVDGYDNFDALFFNISPKEACLIDPQERLFLQTAWQAIADAGYTSKSLSSQRVGVYAGVMWSQYQLLGVDPNYEIDGSVPESLISSVANRISYFFDFHGPSVGLDTMCSSSLTAMHLACEAIRSGEVDCALAGGVNLIVHPNKYLRLAQGNFASSDGRCRSFGAGGNGYVPGEGVGVVVLKPLDKALADVDHIYGVIKASHINHGGKTNGYTVPNPVQQGELIKEAIKKANINPEDISYMEAHGTGTELGDPIEITGLTQAYSSGTDQKNFCSLGSVKSNIGHLESAAGISAVTKILLQLKHDTLVPTLHCEEQNPNIDLNDSPFYLQKNISNWSSVLKLGNGATRELRCAAVSSFGAGGSNAHLIISEAPKLNTRKLTRTTAKHIFIFSAKDKTRLKDYLHIFNEYLEKPSTPSVALEDITHTLQVGRYMEVERLAIVAESRIDLIEKIKLYLANHVEVDSVYVGNSAGAKKSNSLLPEGDSGREYINNLIKNKELTKISALWVQGALVDWAQFYNGDTPCKTSLPSPPFQCSRFWIKQKSKTDQIASLKAIGKHSSLHPLIDANTSTFEQQSFSKTFSGDALYLANHIILGRKLLPGAAFLEMARAAAQLAGAENVSAIQNVRWNAPLSVLNTPVTANINLYLNEKNIDFKIVSDGPGLAQTEFCTGNLIIEKQFANYTGNYVNIKEIQSKLSNYISGNIFYDELKKLGFEYSGNFKSVLDIFYDQNAVVAVLTKTATDQVGKSGCELDVIVIDAAFQSLVTLAGLNNLDDKIRYVPVALGSISCTGDLSSAKYIYGALSQENQKAGQLCFNLKILAENGSELIVIRDFVIAPISVGANGIKSNSIESTLIDGEPRLEFWQTLWAPISSPSITARQNKILIECGRTAPVNFDGIVVKSSATFNTVNRFIIEAEFDNGDCWSKVFNQAKSVYENSSEYHLIINTGSPSNASADLAQMFRTLKALVDGAGRLEFIPNFKLTLVCFSSSSELNHYAALGGFLKCLQIENPRFKCSTLLCQEDITDHALEQLLAANYSNSEARLMAEVKHVDNQYSVKRVGLANIAIHEEENDLSPIHNQGVYLITGGASGIGKIIANHLSNKYHAKLILVGRSPTNNKITKVINDLKVQGSEVIYLQADVTDAVTMQEVIEKSIARFGCINGVIHSAGLTKDRYLIHKTEADFNTVIAPKIEGTVILDAVTANLNLDFFVLFSSLASIIGNAGQVDYATANSYLDEFAAYRQNQVTKQLRSGKTISINWSYWADGGMTISADDLTQIEKSTGLQALTTEIGNSAFEIALRHRSTQILVTYGNTKKISAMLSGKANVVESFDDVGTERPIRPEDAKEIVSQYLKKLVAEETKWEVNKISATETFGTYGIDSVMTLSLTKKLSTVFGELSKTLFFEYSNINSLSQYFTINHAGAIKTIATHEVPYKNIHDKKLVSGTINGQSGTKNISGRRDYLIRQTSIKQPFSKYETEDIAIVGISGRYPDAEDIHTFYDNLMTGKDSIRDIPANRWDNKNFFESNRNSVGKIYSNWGGFIENVDQFDPLFFNISPSDAITMDPQERLFLESSWNTITDAGYTKEILSTKKVGVFVGIMWSHYQFCGVGTHPVQSKKYPESSHASVANRVSYWFGFDGPSLAIDTMCSSSLTAIHLACESIKNGESELALAGGVNLSLHPYKYLQLSSSQFLSTDGRCRSFGQHGDGYVPGEGVGSVLLKPLSKAIADQDHIYGVIKGTAINHGGKSNGFNVPNPQAQSKLIRDVINKSNIESSEISYIEAHGTGTPLGDPIELQGLKNAFSEIKLPKQCAIGSVKSNIGHLEAASGIAGLTKVLLQMQSGKIFPSLHATVLNPNLNFSDSPFTVQTQLKNWEASGSKLLAGISSFGAGGSNAFMLVENFHSAYENNDSPYPALIIPFSARNEKSLLEYLGVMVSYLIKAKTDPNFIAPLKFASLAKTLQIGRSAMQERMAVIASSTDELLEKLTQFLSQHEIPEGVYRGSTNEYSSEQFSSIKLAKEKVPKDSNLLLSREALRDVSRLWVSGHEVDFKTIFEQLSGPKIPLPAYCFDRKRYWYEGDTINNDRREIDVKNSNKSCKIPWQRPSLTNKILIDGVDFSKSTQNGLTFKSQFNSTSEITKNHRLQKRPLLPGAAYIMIVREALEIVEPSKPTQITNVCWHSPLYTEKSTLVFTTIEQNLNGRFYKIWTNGLDDITIHGSGTILSEPPEISKASVHDINAVEIESLSSHIQKEDFYQLFDAYEITYSGSYRCIESAIFSQEQAIGNYRIDGNALDASTADDSAIVDAALQLFVLFQDQQKPEAKLPFSIDQVILCGTLKSSGKIIVTQTSVNKGNATIYDADNNPCVILRSINFRSIKSTNPVEKSISPENTDRVIATELQIRETVTEIICRLMKITRTDIGAVTRFENLGLESVMALEITNELRAIAKGIPSTLLFEYHSIDSLVTYLATEFGAEFRNFLNVKKPLNTEVLKPIVENSDLSPDTKSNLHHSTIEKIKSIFSTSLNIEKHELKDKVNFDSYGIESVKAMEITRALEESYGKLSSTLLYEYQNIESVVNYLVSEKSEQFIEADSHSHTIRTNNADISPTPFNTLIQSLTSDELRLHIDKMNDNEVDNLLNNLLQNADLQTEQNSYES